MTSLLQQRGIDLLPPKESAHTLIQLISAGVEGELVFAGAIGDFTFPSALPQLDSIQIVSDGWIAYRSLNPDVEDWLQDHSINNQPILPGVIGLEMMGEAALSLFPDLQYHGATDVSFKSPLKIYRNKTSFIEVKVYWPTDGVARCTLSSKRTIAGGKTLQTEHFSANVHLQPMRRQANISRRFATPVNLSKEDIYSRFFHGPSFQVLNTIQEAATDSLLALGAVQQSSINAVLKTDPLVLEAAFQAGGMHTMIFGKIMALPSSFSSVHILGHPKDNEELQLLVQKQDDYFNIDVYTSTQCVLQLRGMNFIQSGPLPSDKLIPPPTDGWSESRAIPIAGSETATDIIPRSEQKQLTQRGTVKRQQDRLAGRRAAHQLLQQIQIHSPIHNDEHGRPIVSQRPDIYVSITHRDGQGLATISPYPIGIDEENIAARSNAFLRQWFTASERSLAGDSPLHQTLIWCTKEAVSKALGRGLKLSTKDMEIVAIHPLSCTIRLHNEAAHLLGSRTLQSYWFTQQHQIISIVQISDILCPLIRSA